MSLLVDLVTFKLEAKIFGHLRTMCLKWAVELGIPNIICNHEKPITLPELVSTLEIPLAKAGFV
ncbi:Isoflavone 7-O-methyltransferase [Spatholobus suberectus]|nr:Isoflavone 7-O-methyltransferase [Spatholobus suberectus]